MINDYKANETWKEALKVIKKNAPSGLYEEWEQQTPIAMSPFYDGIYIVESDKLQTDNSFNWIDVDAHNIVFQAVYLCPTSSKDIYNSDFVFIAFHKDGDVRGNYTDYFMFRFDEVEHLLTALGSEEWAAYGGVIEE